MRRACGFTLIELALVIALVGAGFVALMPLFSTAVRALSAGDLQQQVAQYAQECGEAIIGTRRVSGYGDVRLTDLSVCDGIVCSGGGICTGTGFSRTLATVADTSGACPTDVSCTIFSIRVASTVEPTIASTLTLLLANY